MITKQKFSIFSLYGILGFVGGLVGLIWIFLSFVLGSYEEFAFSNSVISAIYSATPNGTSK